MTTLLSAAGAGNGSAVEIPSFANRRFDQLKTIFIFGTFGGSTVTVDISHDNSNWFAIPDLSATADAVFDVEFHARYIRGVVTGGAAQAVDMEMR